MLPSLLLPFAGTTPAFSSEPLLCGPRSAVLGRATIGSAAAIGEDAVVRADGEAVRIGAGVFLGRRATVHIVHEMLPAILGSNVTVGANSVVHACTVADNCVIEEDVTVLDGAMIGTNVLIEAGSTVFPRKRLDAGWIYRGSPAKPVRELRAGELSSRAAAVREREETEPAFASEARDFGAAVFVAHTARTAGRVECAPGSSLFFSVLADAGAGTIHIGENTNVQDNTIIRVAAGETTIGRDTTIGHNVQMGVARVGNASLVGIGAILGQGTWVQDDVLLAAGAITDQDQVLEAGWMWGGRPAKPISRLDEAKRAMMRQNIETYCQYSQMFRRIQQENVAD